MNTAVAGSLWDYWSAAQIGANAIIFCNLLGALLLGLMVGYERTFHGRAAGMRTYGLVCMASSALTVVAGYSDFWFGGHQYHAEVVTTQIIQGIVTGIGFLGAGVIMKEGLNISGLTTAASIWASSSIGILVGLGFYAAAILLTFLSAGCMMLAGRLERWLPSCPAISVVLRLQPATAPSLETLCAAGAKLGYKLARGSISVNERPELREWRFVFVAVNKALIPTLPELAKSLMGIAGVEGVELAHARN